MAKQKSTPRKAAGINLTRINRREKVLETLLQLHIDFCVLGRIREAGPLLHNLMDLAYHVKAPRKATTRPRASKLN